MNIIYTYIYNIIYYNYIMNIVFYNDDAMQSIGHFK